MKIVIEKGIKNLPQCIKIRQEVFVEEQGFVDEFDETDETALHAVAFVDEIPAATARAFEENGVWHIGRVAVLKSFRKQGLGEAVMLAVEEKIKSIGGKEIYLSAQLQAKDFYCKVGYESLEDIHYDQHCPHVTMKKYL